MLRRLEPETTTRMIVKPKVWSFFCTTAHPVGCEKNVREQIAAARILATRGDGPIIPRKVGPKRALIIGASTGYGLATRITAAFGFGAATLGIFLEKPAKGPKTASAGWYNSAAFHAAAKQAGLAAWSINGDAFSDAARARAIEIINEKMGGSVDLVIYSLASPVRRLPGGDKTVHAAIKPIGKPYHGKTIDTDQDKLVDVNLEAASPQEIEETVSVLGGEDWALWMAALGKAGCLAEGAQTLALSYIGPEVTWPIYKDGTIGRAKEHLEKTAKELGGRIAIMKSVVTQASAAIPVIPLYISVAHKVMKQKGLHEEPIDQTNRLFRDFLYRADSHKTHLDDAGRYRLDDRELREDVQQACRELWPKINDGNLAEISDYKGYKQSFLKLFGFGRNDVDYDAETSTDVSFDCIQI